MEKLLYTIEEIFSDTGYLSEQSKKYYNIPHYQRGYKWEPANALKLLNDINNFKTGGDKFYCLQNITIVPNNEKFNIVDGQQRLTTLTIILSYLGEYNLVRDKVRFPTNSIRKETNDFIKNIITNSKIDFPESTWEDYINNQPRYDHQDIYHIFMVYKSIQTWFESKQQNEQNFNLNQFKEKLKKSVQIIVNKVDGNLSEEKVFGNLNSKRIPLDGADLVRAILITRVANEEGQREADIKNIVRTNERRVKIGWELDQINNWWSQNHVLNYFNKFVTIQSEEIGVGNKLFNDIKYPINILYLLYAEMLSEKKLTLELIEKRNSDAIGLYKEILKLHYTLQDWHQDREIYHYLGYLFSLKKKDKPFNFSKIWRLWLDSKTRTIFISELKNMIKTSLLEKNELVDYSNMSINWYSDKQDLLIYSLVLMDVIHCIKENQSFLPYSAFNKTGNDIEHIFPQNPQKVSDKKDYIQFINENYAIKNKFNLSKFDANVNDEKYIEKIEEFITKHTNKFKLNSIGNLVLLYSNLNKSISNSNYADKRAKIITYYNEGNFIQPHTFNVFVRNFNDSNDKNIDIKHWSQVDIESNAKKIGEKIELFLTNTKN
jgi:uncharacterized protein with ParB-like and HNH nuclease domain